MLPDWAEAPMNTPLQEGFKLSTAENSFAEVEFENGSTVRLGQLSMLEFTRLALSPDGSKINHLKMDQGYATFHAALEGQDVYEVSTPDATLTPYGNVRFRVDVDSSAERVEVFNGSLEVASSLGSWTLAKNSVLELRPGTDSPDQLSEGITPDEWDQWVQERESRAESATNSPSPSANSSISNDASYGGTDLSYYGNWSYVSGFGYGWIPMSVRDGTRIRLAAGAGIRVLDTHGFLRTPGVGCLTIMAVGTSFLAPAGCGSLEVSVCGHRH